MLILTSVGSRLRGLLARLLLGIAVTVGVSHLIWSAALIEVYDFNYHHRMLDVRKLRDCSDKTNINSAYYCSNYPTFASELIRSNTADNKNLIVFFGSSVTFGYDFDEREIFSYHIAKALPSAIVLNLSVIGQSTFSIRSASSCILVSATVKPRIIFLELPVINDADAATIARDRKSDPTCESQSVFRYFAGRPFGVNWLSFLRDDYQGRRDPRSAISAPLPSGYVKSPEEFRMVETFINSERIRLLMHLKEHGEIVVAYNSPIWFDGLVKLGFDRANLEYQMRAAIESCRKVPEVICVDTTALSGKAELFFNVSHLGLEGHTFFANWLQERVPAIRQ